MPIDEAFLRTRKKLCIPRDVAFQVFLGTISGGVTGEFIGAIDSALYVSLALLGVLGYCRFVRSREKQSESNSPNLTATVAKSFLSPARMFSERIEATWLTLNPNDFPVFPTS